MKSATKLGKLFLAGGVVMLLGLTTTVGNQAAAQSWTEIMPSGGATPGARFDSSAVFDPASNQMIVFGGSESIPGTGTLKNDVWALSNADGLGGEAAWTEITPAGDSSPSVRIRHSAVYDAASDRMIVFGGDLGYGSCNVKANDVWVLERTQPLGRRPGRKFFRLLCRLERQTPEPPMSRGTIP